MDYSPWGCKVLDTNEHVHAHTHTQDSTGVVNTFALGASGTVFIRATAHPHESSCVNKEMIPLHPSRYILM